MGGVCECLDDTNILRFMPSPLPSSLADPLEEAIKIDSLETVVYLLHTCRLDLTSKLYLYLAVKWGASLDIIKLLVKKGVNLSQVDKRGKTSVDLVGDLALERFLCRSGQFQIEQVHLTRLFVLWRSHKGLPLPWDLLHEVSAYLGDIDVFAEWKHQESLLVDRNLSREVQRGLNIEVSDDEAWPERISPHEYSLFNKQRLKEKRRRSSRVVKEIGVQLDNIDQLRVQRKELVRKKQLERENQEKGVCRVG